MILAKLLYNNNDFGAEAIFAGDPNYFEIELKAILESMSKDDALRPILLKSMNDIAGKLEKELTNGK